MRTCGHLILLCSVGAVIGIGAGAAVAGDCYGIVCHQYFYCLNYEPLCGGVAAEGSCQPRGLFCARGDCHPPEKGSDPHHVCSWQFRHECYGPGTESEWCVEFTGDYLASGCSPTCKWVFYNHCVCECAAFLDFSEAGSHTYCRTYTWSPCE